MRFIRTTNNIAEFLETNDRTGEIISSMGFQFGEVYYLIKNKKVSFYLNDSEKPFDNFIWSLDIPFEMDGVLYEDEDTASAHLYNVFNDRFQEQLDELRADLEEEIGRSIATDEALGEEIDDERARAVSAETHLQDEMEVLSATVATFDERITRAEEDARQAFEYTEAEIARSTAKDAEHDAQISGLTNVLNSEIQRALNAESGITANLNAEIAARQADVDAEEARALLAESGITANLNAEITNRQADVDAEEARALLAESGITANLNAEIQNRIADVDAEETRALIAESGITANLNAEIAAREADVDAEEARALLAESGLSDTINAEIARSTGKDAQHDAEISNIIDDIASLEERKQNKLIAGKYISISGDVISADSNHVYRLTQAAYDALQEIDLEGLYIITDAPDVDLSNYTPLTAFTAEVNRSVTKDNEHDAQLSAFTSGLATETQNRIAADTALQTNLTNEHNRAISAETEIADDLDAEEARATARENSIDDKVDAEVARATSKDSAHDTAISGLTSDLATEVSNRTAADTALQTNLTNEHNRAISAETALHDEIINERDRALAAESGLTTNLSAEIQNRINGDNALDTAKADKTQAVASAMYDSANHNILFKNISGTVLSTIDATDFIKDGMVDDVRIENGYLVIDFNTDSGKRDISIPLTDIFNPANYYDKTATDALLATKLNTSDFASYSALTKTSIDGKLNTSEFVAYSAATDNILDNVYQKDETSGATEISTALAEKLDVTAYTPVDLSNYYQKNETSGKTEISNALALKANSSDVYLKSETSGATEISTALNAKLDATAYTPTDLSNYYQKSETSGKTEISSALAEKLAVSDFNVYSGATDTLINSKAAQSTVDTLSGTVNTHITDSDIHVTTAQTASWSAKPDVWCGTQAQYDQIATKDPNTLYLIH